MSHDLRASAALSPLQKEKRAENTSSREGRCGNATEKITGIFVRLEFRMLFGFFYRLNAAAQAPRKGVALERSSWSRLFGSE